MTNHPHPITPPPELVEKWVSEIWHEGTPVRIAASDIHIATQAAQWGSDQELEECVKWLEQNCGRWELPAGLRAARRPKPPSLKAQALEVVTGLEKRWDLQCDLTLLRRALEQLND